MFYSSLPVEVASGLLPSVQLVQQNNCSVVAQHAFYDSRAALLHALDDYLHLPDGAEAAEGAGLGPQSGILQSRLALPSNSAAQQGPQTSKEAGGSNKAAEQPVKRPRGRPKNQVDTPKLSQSQLQQIVDEKQQQVQRLTRENSFLREKMRMLELVIRCRDQQLEALQTLASIVPGRDSAPSSSELEMLSVPVEWNANSLSLIKSSSAQQIKLLIKRLYRQAASQVSDALIAVEQGPDDETAKQKLGLLLQNVLDGATYLALLAPSLYTNAGTSVSDNTVDDHAPEHHWDQVAAALHLNDTQKLDCCILYEMHKRWVQKVLVDRRKLTVRLSKLITNAKGHRLGSDPTSTEQQQVLELLHNNVSQERCLLQLVDHVMKTDVLTNMQTARLIVHAYPHLPDMLALLAAMAKQHTEGNPESEVVG